MPGQRETISEKFATTTTLHGLQYLVTSKYRPVKLVWLVIFLASFSLCVWQISLRVRAYLEFNTNTKIKLIHVDQLVFPAVTICNFNRYRLSAITENDTALLRYIIDVDNDGYDASDTSFNENFDYEEFKKGLDDEYSGGISTSNFTQRTGFQMKDSLLKCKWRGRNCTYQNFTHIFTTYGNCWTFNIGDELHSQERAGTGNGLSIWIDIEQDEYTEKSTGNIEVGLKILVHDQSIPPLMDTRGLAISPGVHAYVGVHKVKVNNLEPRFGTCSKEIKLEHYSNYSISGCIIECRLKNILKKCNCRPPRYPGSETECSPSVTSTCVKEVLERMQKESSGNCRCPVACEYVSYDTTVNYVNVPGISAAIDFAKPKKNRPLNYSYIRENLIWLDVFYEEMSYEEFTETEAMTFSALLSDIGGQLGLFIGASVITVAEVGQFIFLKIKSVSAGKSTKRKIGLHDVIASATADDESVSNTF